MFERFAGSTRNAVRYGVEEAQRRGDRRVGTDHLLLGVLRDADSAALVGVSIDDARETADALDRKALVAIGIDIGDFRPSAAPRKAHSDPIHLRCTVGLATHRLLTRPRRSRGGSRPSICCWHWRSGNSRMRQRPCWRK